MGFAPAMASRRQRSRKALVSLPKIEPPQTKKRPPRWRPLAEGNRRSLVLDLARTDLAGPLTGRCRLVLDELLESLQVVLDTTRRRLDQLVADLAHRASRRIVVERELDLRVPVHRLKLDLAVVLVTGHGTPRDQLVRLLLGDLSCPLTLGARDLRLPLEMLVVELANFLDILHELGEVFELGPLGVDLVDRLADLNRLLDMRHAVTLPGRMVDGFLVYTINIQ